MSAASQPSSGVFTGYCSIADVTYCGDDQPIVHNDEIIDAEEYEVSGSEYDLNDEGARHDR